MVNCLNLAAQRAAENKVLTNGAVVQRAITSSDEDTVVMDTDYADDMAQRRQELLAV